MTSSDDEQQLPIVAPDVNQTAEVKPKKEEPFDLVTKCSGTINKKVLDRQRKSIERVRRRQDKKKNQRERSLAELENEVERLLLKETIVLITQEFVDRMRTHYNLVMEEEIQEQHKKQQEEGMEAFSHQAHDKVHLEALVVSIYNDEYFEPHLNMIVRESVDGEKENLEQLLNRVLNDFKKPQISWL